MTKTLVRWLLPAFTFGFALLLLPPARAQEQAIGPLVSAEWLQRNLQRADLLLLDASMGHERAAAGHIPGSVHVEFYAYGMRDLPPAQMERLIQGWGVSPGRKVVLYDAGGTYMAARVLWDLYRHGVPAADLAILDGGIARWKAAGGAVTKQPTPAPQPGSFKVTAVNDDVRVRLNEFLLASGDPARNTIVDALPPSQHWGEAMFFDRGGHIPNAVLWPSEELFNTDKTFKSVAELQRMADFVGIRREQTVMSYCGGGVAAAGPWFVLKFVLGYPQVKLYRESLFEWLQDERGLPLWTWDAPQLQRSMQWVNAWTNKMIRQFTPPAYSVIDVRSAEAHGLGHVPYSLSIPAERFAVGLTEPAKLAELLGPAGVDARHEAVIVSDGGINPRSALAFLALERLGQRKVSILIDSVDEWGLRGLPLTKEPTVVGAPKSPMEIAIRPVPYTATPRQGPVIRDPAAAPGRYPKVFVASGKALPAKAPQGTVVHLPYTELLEADGRPKAAKDLWRILTKAGVPRYAEVVAIADDPGEAAVTYYILKLMGWVDVKVLVG